MLGMNLSLYFSYALSFFFQILYRSRSSQREYLMGINTFPFLAFEFSKRQFSQKYGSELPVWALLASGSTGGVCVSTPHLDSSHLSFQISYWLACYPLGSFTTFLDCFLISICRCCQVPCPVEIYTAHWYTFPIHCTRT